MRMANSSRTQLHGSEANTAVMQRAASVETTLPLKSLNYISSQKSPLYAIFDVMIIYVALTSATATAACFALLCFFALCVRSGSLLRQCTRTHVGAKSGYDVHLEYEREARTLPGEQEKKKGAPS